MASRSHTLYIGVTNDLQKRAFEHKWKEHGGFTARYDYEPADYRRALDRMDS